MVSRDMWFTPETLVPRNMPGTGTADIIDAGAFRLLTDQDGNQLDGSLHYRVLGSLHMPGTWWSIGLYDGDGFLTPNSEERYAFTSFNLIPENDGTIVIDVASERPENALNWLPCRREEPFFLVVRFYEWGTRVLNRVSAADLAVLPRIRRTVAL